MKKMKYFIVLIVIIAGAISCKKTTCDAVEQDTFPYKCETGMDVAFLIDYTASMGGVIDSIKTNINSIVNTIVTKSAGDYRLSLSIFDETTKSGLPLPYITKPDYTGLPVSQRIINTTGITTDQYLTMMEKFSTANKTTFNTQLAKLNVPGSMPLGYGIGGAEPGSMLADKIINSSFAGTWRAFKNRIVIIITDAPDGGDDDKPNATDDTFLSSLATIANTNQFQFILVTSQPATDPLSSPYLGFAANYSVKLIANNTGGLQSTSTNLKNIAPIINQMINNLCEINGK